MRAYGLLLFFLTVLSVSTLSQDADKLIAESRAFEKKCAGIHDLVSKSGKVYFYSGESSNRFKVYGENRYRNFKKGDCFLIAYDGRKSYLRDSKSDIYAPTSEISYSFDKYVTPSGEYLESLRAQIAGCYESIAKLDDSIKEDTAQMNKNIDQLVVLLADDTVTRAVFYDVNGNCIIPERLEFSTAKNRLTSRLMTEVRRLDRKIKASRKLIDTKESDKGNLIKVLKDVESVLSEYYKKYPQTRPENEAGNGKVPATGK